MSNVKYDAITGSGIEVGERVKIPDALVPADARVEIEAKIAAGYFTDGSVPDDERAGAQCKGRGLVTDAARRHDAPRVAARRRRRSASAAAAIAARGRARALARTSRSTARGSTRRPSASQRVTRAALSRRSHSVSQPLAPLRGRRRRPQAPSSTRARRPQRRVEQARARIDLAVVSVLLDAGAGAALALSSKRETGQRFTRSEGLASRAFAPSWRGASRPTPDDPLRVDAAGAAAASTPRRWREMFQVERRQPAGRPRGPRRAAAPPRRGAARAARLHRSAAALRRATTAHAVRLRCHAAPARACASRRAAHPARAARCLQRDLAERAARSTACRSAMSGAHPLAGGDGAERRLGAVSQAVASGSPTRCSSRSSGPASRSTGSTR